MSESTAVAKRDERKDLSALSPEREARIAEGKARTAVAKAIRGTVWGKDCHPTVVDAVIAYCRQNQLDAVRHVEVLGGNIYLTATFYQERGAPLLYAGDVVMAEPDYINADERLEKLAKDGDGWAVKERLRRLQQRIQFNVPEAAKAAVVQRATLRSGMTAVGVNWCGHGGKRDPVGDAEPTKTAQTRALRRCWRQIADFVPSYGSMVKPIEQNAKGALPVAVIDPPGPGQQRIASGAMVDTSAEEHYTGESGHSGQANDGDADLEADREIVAREGGELSLNDKRSREPGEEG